MNHCQTFLFKKTAVNQTFRKLTYLIELLGTQQTLFYVSRVATDVTVAVHVVTAFAVRLCLRFLLVTLYLEIRIMSLLQRFI